MAASTQAPEIPNLEFQKLGPFVSLYTPPPPIKPSSKSDPTTILFCQWMGASPRSRALNAAYHRHHALYPAARIVLMRSEPAWFLTTPTSTRQKQLSPAVAAIEADPAGAKRKILVHVFSNGGNVAFHEICVMYHEKHGKRLEIEALAIDSAPGRPNWTRNWRAMSVGLPRGILWWVGAVVLWFVNVVSWVWTEIVKMETVMDVAREGLLEFDIMDRKARRLYMYSTKDAIVDWKVVDGEAKKAGERGLDVSIYRNERDPHVQCMIKDADRYWKAVEDLWDGTRR